jgi:hypothetical protein
VSTQSKQISSSTIQLNLENAVETGFRGSAVVKVMAQQMRTDNQSNTNSRGFIPQMTRFEPESSPELLRIRGDQCKPWLNRLRCGGV